MAMSTDGTCSRAVSCCKNTQAAITTSSIGLQCAATLLISANSQTEEGIPEIKDDDEDVLMAKQQWRALAASGNKKKRKAKTQLARHGQKLQEDVQKKQEQKLAVALVEMEGDTVSRSAYRELEQKLEATKQELAMSKMASKCPVCTDASTNTDIESVTEVVYADMKKRLSKLENEVNDLRSLNVTLQRALTSKILSVDEKHTCTTSSDLPIIIASSPSDDMGYKSGHHGNAAEKPKQQSKISFKPKQQRPEGPKEDGTVKPAKLPTAVPPGVQPGATMPAAGCVKPSTELSTASSTEEISIGSMREDGKLYAGCGTWVSKDTWEALFEAPTDSVFCRRAAISFWTEEQLRKRSVTGTLSNKARSLGKTVPKPALTPRKVESLKALFQMYITRTPSAEPTKNRLKAVRKHLAGKLGDMQRK